MNGRIIKFEGSVHVEADRLLPWWVNGTLPQDECIQVEQHLAECVPCQHEVAWLRTLQETCGAAAAPSDIPHTMRRLRRRAQKEHANTAVSPASATTLARRGRRLWWLVAAQAVLILALGLVMLQDRHATYHTLSAPTEKGLLLVVVFDPHISEMQLRQLVRANDARIVGGPTEAGAYLIRVPDNKAIAARKMLHDSAGVTMVENLETGGEP